MSTQARSNRPKVTRQNCVAELCGGPGLSAVSASGGPGLRPAAR